MVLCIMNGAYNVLAGIFGIMGLISAIVGFTHVAVFLFFMAIIYVVAE